MLAGKSEMGSQRVKKIIAEQREEIQKLKDELNTLTERLEYTEISRNQWSLQAQEQEVIIGEAQKILNEISESYKNILKRRTPGSQCFMWYGRRKVSVSDQVIKEKQP